MKAQITKDVHLMDDFKIHDLKRLVYFKNAGPVAYV